MSSSIINVCLHTTQALTSTHILHLDYKDSLQNELYCSVSHTLTIKLLSTMYKYTANMYSTTNVENYSRIIPITPSDMVQCIKYNTQMLYTVLNIRRVKKDKPGIHFHIIHENVCCDSSETVLKRGHIFVKKNYLSIINTPIPSSIPTLYLELCVYSFLLYAHIINRELYHLRMNCWFEKIILSIVWISGSISLIT